MNKFQFDPTKHHRRSIRLKGYDYASEGAYFVTIVTQGRECLFGEIHDGKMILNEAGQMIVKWWNELRNKFPNVILGVFMVMPNHFHGIIIIEKNVGVGVDLRVCPNGENISGRTRRFAPTEIQCAIVTGHSMVQNNDDQRIYSRCKTIRLDTIYR